MDVKLTLGLAAAVAAAAALFHLTPPLDIPPPPAEKPVPPALWEKHPDFRGDVRKWGGVTIIAPASGLKKPDEPRAHAIADALDVRFPQGALKPGVVPYNAVDDATRRDLFVAALNDPGTTVLWALRGGYGASRLLTDLEKLPKPTQRKIFVGYSDMTFLHLFFQRWGWPTVHGAMFWELSTPAAGGKDWENYRRLTSLLSGETKELRYSGLKPVNAAAREAKEPLEGVLLGGNLTCLAAASGTPWAVKGEGAILFIEDVREGGYKLDRMFTQLRLAGAFDGAKAVLLGAFTKGDDDTEYALDRFAEDLPLPVFRTDLFGHGEKNYPLILNAPAVLEKAEGKGGADEEPDFSLRMDAGGLFAE